MEQNSVIVKLGQYSIHEMDILRTTECANNKSI